MCPCRENCTRSKGPRTLHLLPQAQQEALLQARLQQTTPEFQNLYAARAGIEGTLSQQIRKCHMRRSRYIGQVKTHLQHLLTAAAINLARYVAWVEGIPLAQTRVGPFAALASVA